jgi:protein involved in polysaccharide export with SLBB domain
MVRTHRVTLVVLAALFVTAVVLVAGIKLSQAEPPTAPTPPVTPTPPKPPSAPPAAESRKVSRSPHRYSDLATLNYSGGGPSGNGSILWPTGYTVATRSDPNTANTEILVSLADQQGSESSEMYRVMAMDKHGKLHDPEWQTVVSGGGTKLCVITIVSNFSLHQEDIVKLIVQQSIDSEPPRAAAKPPADQRGQSSIPDQPFHEPYRVQPLDVLTIRAMGTLLDQPIDGKYLVEPDGQVALGPGYGRADVKGLTIAEAEQKITRKLQEVLAKPEVQVTAAGRATQWRDGAPPTTSYTIKPGDRLFVYVVGTLLDQPIHGIYQVEPTGTIPLGPGYGRAQVRGLTLEAAEEAIQKKLSEVLTKPEVQVTFAGWMSDADVQRLDQIRIAVQAAAAQEIQRQRAETLRRGSAPPNQKRKDTKK